jgi:hypothetical protein
VWLPRGEKRRGIGKDEVRPVSSSSQKILQPTLGVSRNVLEMKETTDIFGSIFYKEIK